MDNQKFQGANLAGGSHRLPVAETAVAEAAAIAEATVAKSTVAEWTVEETAIAEAAITKPVAPAAAREIEELSVRFTGWAEATCL